MHPLADVVVGEAHQSLDLRPFDQRPCSVGWFGYMSIERFVPVTVRALRPIPSLLPTRYASSA